MPSPTDLLPLGPRYQGAWSEVAARLQSRQLVNLSFATAVVSACAAILGTMQTTVEDRWPFVLSIALAVLSWIYAWWIRNNDAMVGLLGAHNQACEVIRRSRQPGRRARVVQRAAGLDQTGRESTVSSPIWRASVCVCYPRCRRWRSASLGYGMAPGPRRFCSPSAPSALLRPDTCMETNRSGGACRWPGSRKPPMAGN